MTQCRNDCDGSTPEGLTLEYMEEKFDNFDGTANLVVPDWDGIGRAALVSNSGYYLHSDSNTFNFVSYGRDAEIPGNVQGDSVGHFFDSDTRDSIMSYDFSDVLYRSFYIDGTVATQQLYTMSRKTIKRAFGDIDGDGVIDVVVHARGGGTTSGQYKLVSWISGADNFSPILTLPPTDAPTLPPPTLSPSRSSPPTFGGMCLGGTNTKRCSTIFRSQSCNACYGSCSYIASDCEIGCGAVSGCRCSVSIQPCILGTGTNRVSCSGTTTSNCSTFTNQKTCAAESDCYWQPNEVPIATATTSATTIAVTTSTVVTPTPELKSPEPWAPSSAPNIPVRTTQSPSLTSSDDSPVDESSTDAFLPTHKPSGAAYMPTAAQDTSNTRIEESSSDTTSRGCLAKNSCHSWFFSIIWLLLSAAVHFV